MVISQTCSHFTFNLGCRSNSNSCFGMAKATTVAGAKNKDNVNANSKDSSSSRQQGKAKRKAKSEAKGKGRHSPGIAAGQRRAKKDEGRPTPAHPRSQTNARSSCAATPEDQRPPGGHWLHAVGGDKAQLLKQSRSWLMMTCTELGLNVLAWTKADLAEVLSLQFCEGQSPSESAMRLAGARSFACSA